MKRGQLVTLRPRPANATVPRWVAPLRHRPNSLTLTGDDCGSRSACMTVRRWRQKVSFERVIVGRARFLTAAGAAEATAS